LEAAREDDDEGNAKAQLQMKELDPKTSLA
jgi:hypothetical protein